MFQINQEKLNEGLVDDDDIPCLSAEAMAALQEFYLEEDLRTGNSLNSGCETKMPKENWQLSQFWYDDETSTKLAKEGITSVGINGRIACLSCPSIYTKILEISSDVGERSICLEYDKRFEDLFGKNFLYYDYNEPLNLPKDFHNAFDLVVLDPPFLSKECLEKCSKTVHYLTKKKILLCTGAVMKDLAKELLDVKKHDFIPKHSNNLSNNFSCYVNYKTVIL